MNHDELGNYSHTEVRQLREQLAAAQATIERMRSLLPKFCPKFGEVGTRDVDVAVKQKAFDEALALPSDITALQARLAAEREKCAAHLDQVARDYKKASEELSALVAEYCTDAIRSMK